MDGPWRIPTSTSLILGAGSGGCACALRPPSSGCPAWGWWKGDLGGTCLPRRLHPHQGRCCTPVADQTR